MSAKKAQLLQKSLQLKLTLRYTKPPVWRRIVVPDNCSLGSLHSIIQRAMGWSGAHLHEFRVPRRGFGPPLRQFGHEGENEDLTAVGQVLVRKGQVLLYEYDFGDGWLHEIKLEEVLPVASAGVYPSCLAGARACPPEDCGGVPGYYRLLQALKKPSDPENAELLDWSGEYDPAAFDVASVNSHLPRKQWTHHS